MAVDLAGFHDLQGYGTIIVSDPEWSSTRFPFVFNHAANPDGSIELINQVFDLFFFLPGFAFLWWNNL